MKFVEEFKKAVEKGKMPIAHVIALDAVCVVVHPSNGVEALTTEQIQKIYKGDIKNWKDVGGPDLEIVAISRDTSSGTGETFKEKVMLKEKMAEGVQYVAGNPDMFNRVKETKGAIGYVGLGFLQKDIKVVTVNGIKPNRQTVINGTFPLARPLFFFTNGYPTMGSALFNFCTFHLTKEGARLIEDKGFIAMTDY